MKSKIPVKMIDRVFAVVAVMAMLTDPVWPSRAAAMHAGPHHSFLGGPWEVVVKMGMGGDGLCFPLVVSDESKPQKLDDILTVLNSPIKVELEQYIPDLTWETTAVQHPDGGIVVRLTVKGKDLEQSLWLSPGDPARQSVSSRIGSIAIRRFYNPDTAEALVRKLTDPQAVGLLSVWMEEGNRPFECVAKVKETITLPESKYKITVAQYVPHYSIDTETRKVSSQSDKPVNPAIKVLLNDGKRTVERWLWAKFLSSPHEQKKLPLRMRFTDFNLQETKGNYILAVASRTQAWMLLSEKGRKRLEKVGPGRSYPFADKEYSFIIEEFIDDAIIKNQWKNNSERLLHPAVVATIQQEGTGHQTVLELNKPFHLKTKTGVLVLLYRRRPASSGAAR
ncbi:hypothetical protein ACFL5Z_00580 [Planctomycetota bacterium]